MQAANLYGTTDLGGTYLGPGDGLGTVFKLSPPSTSGGNWTESVLWNFGNGTDGANPFFVRLIMDTGGNLYGTTANGGPYDNLSTGGRDSGGTVFKLTAQGNESVLWNFGNGTDGRSPYTGLIVDPSGNLYGTTTGGGAYSGPLGNGAGGTVFEISGVVSIPKIILKPKEIVFPNTAIGSTSTAKLLVRNTGTAPLIGAVNTPPAPFGLSGSGSFHLAPNTHTIIKLTFTPTSKHQVHRIDTVASNAANHSTVHLELESKGSP
jgi:hypothetical protein